MRLFWIHNYARTNSIDNQQINTQKMSNNNKRHTLLKCALVKRRMKILISFCCNDGIIKAMHYIEALSRYQCIQMGTHKHKMVHKWMQVSHKYLRGYNEMDGINVVCRWFLLRATMQLDWMKWDSGEWKKVWVNILGIVLNIEMNGRGGWLRWFLDYGLFVFGWYGWFLLLCGICWFERNLEYWDKMSFISLLKCFWAEFVSLFSPLVPISSVSFQYSVIRHTAIMVVHWHNRQF